MLPRVVVAKCASVLYRPAQTAKRQRETCVRATGTILSASRASVGASLPVGRYDSIS